MKSNVYYRFTARWAGAVALAVGVGLGTFSSVRAGIPEPDLVWYGKVLMTSGDVAVRATVGTLTWQIEPMAGGTPWVLSTTLTNINDQFSFALRVPCESMEPAVPATAGTVVLTSPPSSYRRVTVTLDGQPLTIMSAPNQFAPAITDRGRSERIDLALGNVPVDTDGDGLADSWEMQHFGGLSALPGDDPDHDGMSNLREYRAGTNPTDARSRFEMVEIQSLPEGIYVRWSSQPNRHYRLRRSSDLLGGAASYQVVQSGLAATPPFNEFIDTSPRNGAAFFYVLEIQE
jgi:hypothetical protein